MRNPENLTSIYELGRHNFAGTDYLSYGGGSFGGDGYFAYVNAEYVEWVFFFDWSGEFDNCRRGKDNGLIVYQDDYSTEGCLIDKLRPEKIEWVSVPTS